MLRSLKACGTSTAFLAALSCLGSGKPDAVQSQKEYLQHEREQLVVLSDSLPVYEKVAQVTNNCSDWKNLGEAKRRLALGKTRIGLKRDSEEFKALMSGAVESYENATNICPDEEEIIKGLGDSYSSLGRYSEAIRAYEVLSLKDPRNETALIALAQLNDWQDSLEASSYWYGRALAVDPSNSGTLRLSYANILDKLGKTDEAFVQRQIYANGDQKVVLKFNKDRYMELVRNLQINELLAEAKRLRNEEHANRDKIVALYLEGAQRVQTREKDPEYTKEAHVLSRQLRLAASFYDRRKRDKEAISHDD